MYVTHNIVHIELFDVGGSATTVEGMMEKCLKRAATRQPILTALRLEDLDRTMTDPALACHEERRRLGLWHKDISRMKQGWRRSYNEWLYRRELRLHRRHTDDMIALCAKLFTAAFKLDRPIAVQYFDQSFRLVQPHERHELRELVLKIVDMQVRIFIPNELCAERNRAIAAVSS